MTRSAPLKTVRGQLRRAVSEARGAGRITTALEVDVLLADRLAGEVDRLWAASEMVEARRVTRELRAVLSGIPLDDGRFAQPVPLSGVASDDGGGDARGAVVLELDRPPAVGNAAHTG